MTAAVNSEAPAFQALIEAGYSTEMASNPWWRVSNLYTIVDDEGRQIPFRPREVQEELWRRLWFRNVILKSRQHGYCLDPDTRILTADLRWIRIADAVPGLRIVGVDEEASGRGNSRCLREAVVEAACVVRRLAYRITFDDGRSVVCTGKHPWLSRRVATDWTWRTIEGEGKKRLRVGTKVRWVTKTWDAQDYEDGWFAGMIDGEGHLANNGRAYLCVYQLPGAVFDRMKAYMDSRGYNYRIESDKTVRKGQFGKRVCPKIAVNRTDELIRLMGQCRPSRFVDRRWWAGKTLPGKRVGAGYSSIVAIEKLDERDMIDLQTSTGTYIAEGFVSHNTTLLALIALDQCLFVPDFDAAIIADTLDNVGRIFERKVLRPFELLHPLLREAVGVKNESKTGMRFSNGSFIDVALTTRGGTKQFLHVSEMGRIAARDPAKAKEIITGGFESVPQTGFIFVESTAEGVGGAFHDLVKEAQRVKEANRKLLPLEWRLHFVPWWRKPSNRVDHHDGVTITAERREYFAGVEAKTGARLDPAQRAWYVLKEATLGDHMLAEHPSTEEEPFFVSDEGRYYAKQIMALRRKGAIGRFPHVPGVPVNTFWDLGQRDYTTIWFHQRINGIDRFVYYYENSGEPWLHYKRVMDETGFVFGRHYLPHDAGKVVPGGEALATIEQQFNALLIRPTYIVPRVTDVLVGIQMVRDVLPNCQFDAEDCAIGVQRLEEYSKDWNENLGVWRDTPRHDAASHGADGFRMFAQVYQDLKGLGATSVMKPAPRRELRLGVKTAAKRRGWRTA